MGAVRSGSFYPADGGVHLARVADSVLAALKPFLGETVSQYCLRTILVSLDRTAETLSLEDMPHVEGITRAFVARVLPKASADAIVEAIRREVGS